LAELRLELSLNRASGVLAGIVASLAQAGLQLTQQKLDRDPAGRGGWLVVRAAGDAPDPAVLAERLAGTRGVARVERIEIDGEAVLIDGAARAESGPDPIDRDDLAELALGAEAAAAPDTSPAPEREPASESEAEPEPDSDSEPEPEPQAEPEPEPEAESQAPAEELAAPKADPWLNPDAAEDRELEDWLDPSRRLPDAGPMQPEADPEDLPLLSEMEDEPAPAAVADADDRAPAANEIGGVGEDLAAAVAPAEAATTDAPAAAGDAAGAPGGRTPTEADEADQADQDNDGADPNAVANSEGRRRQSAMRRRRRKRR
jgi:hypothetical protein